MILTAILLIAQLGQGFGNNGADTQIPDLPAKGTIVDGFPCPKNHDELCLGIMDNKGRIYIVNIEEVRLIGDIEALPASRHSLYSKFWKPKVSIDLNSPEYGGYTTPKK